MGVIEETFAGHEVSRQSLDACVKCTICETMCPVAKATPLYTGPKYNGPQGERYRDGASVDHSSSGVTSAASAPCTVRKG